MTYVILFYKEHFIFLCADQTEIIYFGKIICITCKELMLCKINSFVLYG